MGGHISYLFKKSRLQLNTHAYIRSSKDEQIRLHTKTIGTHVGYLTTQKLSCRVYLSVMCWYLSTSRKALSSRLWCLFPDLKTWFALHCKKTSIFVIVLLSYICVSQKQLRPPQFDCFFPTFCAGSLSPKSLSSTAGSSHFLFAQQRGCGLVQGTT